MLLSIKRIIVVISATTQPIKSSVAFLYTSRYFFHKVIFGDFLDIENLDCTGAVGVCSGPVDVLLASDVGKRPTGSGSADAISAGALFSFPPGGASQDPEGASLGGGSPSLVSSLPNAHTEGVTPCGGWLRELCSHGNVRWIPLRCHKWQCEDCSPGKHMEFLERLRGANTLARSKNWS